MAVFLGVRTVKVIFENVKNRSRVHTQFMAGRKHKYATPEETAALLVRVTLLMWFLDLLFVLFG